MSSFNSRVNIYYIRAAIESACGVRLSLKEVRRYLQEEGMITKSQAKHIIFPGYEALNGKVRESAEERAASVLALDKEIEVMNGR